MSHVFPIFCIMAHNQFGTKIKKIRSDNVHDYFNQILSQWFQKEGIIHESSCIITPQQNGVVERKTVILLSVLEPYCFNKMYQNLTGERLYSHQHVINMIPSRVLGCKSPLETLSQFYPNI